jgi:hypothetical protein
MKGSCGYTYKQQEVALQVGRRANNPSLKVSMLQNGYMSLGLLWILWKETTRKTKA